MKLAIIGSRSITNINLSDYINDLPDTIISGGALGIDRKAERFAKNNNIPLIVYLPEYARYGKGAPLRRNHLIVKEADSILAIWDGKSKGTMYTIDLAKKQGKAVQLVTIADD